jgi:hypothetical protein
VPRTQNGVVLPLSAISDQLSGTNCVRFKISDERYLVESGDASAGLTVCNENELSQAFVVADRFGRRSLQKRDAAALVGNDRAKKEKLADIKVSATVKK